MKSTTILLTASMMVAGSPAFSQIKYTTDGHGTVTIDPASTTVDKNGAIVPAWAQPLQKPIIAPPLPIAITPPLLMSDTAKHLMSLTVAHNFLNSKQIASFEKNGIRVFQLPSTTPTLKQKAKAVAVKAGHGAMAAANVLSPFAQIAGAIGNFFIRR